MVLSFALVIVLLLAVAVQTNVTIREVDTMHRDNINFIFARRELVYRIQGDFMGLRFMLRDSFMSEAWLNEAPQHTRRFISGEISDSYAALVLLMDEYKQLAIDDPLIPEERMEMVLEHMELAQEYLYYVYAQFTNHFFPGGDHSEELGYVNLYMNRIELILEFLADLSLVSAREVSRETDMVINRSMNRTIAMVLGAFAGTLVLAIIMIISFAKRVHEIEERVHDLGGESASGNGDEFSRIYNSLSGIIEHKQRASEIAEENSTAKSRFLARMSHEIRTPLTAVLGISEIQLQNPTISLVVEEAFAKIYNSSNILLSLVNDILDLSRIEAGKLETLNKPYEVASMVIDVVQMHLIYLGSKKVEFKVNTDESLPAYLIGDEIRLRQVLNNLLSNAFKYTDTGTVELSLKRLPHKTSGMITLQVSIRDTGHGMSPENLKSLTEEYTRFHEREYRLVEGTGLGMSIVYSLLQLMNGTIDIESEVGVGTHVLIHIPQEISGGEIIGREIAENLMSVDNLSSSLVKRVKFIPEPMPYGKVLVVDDIDTNLYVARGLLMFYDLQIETCISGREAIELIQDGQEYDIIFMDQMMPEMDGIEATKNIRKLGYLRPIVALTANALIGQSEIFLANGFDNFLSKPIQTVHLNGILNKYIRDNQSPEVLEAAKIKITSNNNTGINSFLEREMAKLKKDFYNGQKNTVKNIRGALATSDFETAHRLAHTLKGLAGLIKETELEKVAYEAETLLRTRKIPKDEIDILERKLSKILAGIEADLNFDKPDELDKEFSPLSEKHITVLLDGLEELLTGNDAMCLQFTEDLAKIPETKVLVKQIENYDFAAALLTLKTMRTVLEI